MDPRVDDLILVISTKPSSEEKEEILGFLDIRIKSSRQCFKQRINENNLYGRASRILQKIKECRRAFNS